MQWTGFSTPTATGDYLFGTQVDGFGQRVGGWQEIVTTLMGQEHERRARFTSRKGILRETRGPLQARSARASREAQLLWSPVNNAPDPAAVAAAKKADVVVAVVGITSRLEGEEMPVSQPGFSGGDRTSLDLPKPKKICCEALAGTWQAARRRADERQRARRELGEGSRQRHSRCLVLRRRRRSRDRRNAERQEQSCWTPSRHLLQRCSPAAPLRRLFDEEPHLPLLRGRTALAVWIRPQLHNFAYSNLMLPDTPLNAGDPLHASVTVTNTGKIAGDEVVELYLQFPDVSGAPRRALRGFQRVHLEPGASQKVDFQLNPRDLSMVDRSGGHHRGARQVHSLDRQRPTRNRSSFSERQS